MTATGSNSIFRHFDDSYLVTGGFPGAKIYYNKVPNFKWRQNLHACLFTGPVHLILQDKNLWKLYL